MNKLLVCIIKKAYEMDEDFDVTCFIYLICLSLPSTVVNTWHELSHLILTTNLFKIFFSLQTFEISNSINEMGMEKLTAM